MYFNPKDFGKRVQLARKAAGMTQQELADALCVDRDHIGRMERGVRVCSIDLLVELSSILDVSTDYLLMGKPDSKIRRKTSRPVETNLLPPAAGRTISRSTKSMPI